MNDLDALQQQIKAKLAASDERRRAMQAGLQQEMKETERRSKRFAEVATPLFRTIVRPRMETLAGFFENARIQSDVPTYPLHCVCDFDHCELYPATTKLTLGIDPDNEMRKVIVGYSLEILPIFFRFDGHDQRVLEVDRADAEAVAEWVDKKILDFLDVYTELQHVDQYQRDNLVGDPVCGMYFNRTLAPVHIEHEGRSYYFCTEECRQRFAENPSKYLPKKKT